MASKNQEPYVLLDWYVKCWTAKYGHAPKINKYREKWGFGDMADSVGLARAKELVSFYMDTSSNTKHNTTWLLYNFDKLDVALEEREKDRERRALVRKVTEQRMRELQAENE